MTTVFGAGYSGAYDALYQDKDYNAEVDMIERLFKKYGETVKSVIDFGCGTGNHSIPLARRSYQVVGVDRSEDMLASAWVKAGSLPPLTEINFFHGDLRTFRADQTFDAAIMMFAVLGYMTSNADVSAALATVRAHLNAGGVFVFDVWYGPAVLHMRPSERVKELAFGNTRLIRSAAGELDTYQHTCRVDYHIWRLDGDRFGGETHESHTMRYFFAQELAYFLSQSGFELLNLGTFPDLSQPPDENTWNITAVAKAV